MNLNGRLDRLELGPRGSREDGAAFERRMNDLWWAAWRADAYGEEPPRLRAAEREEFAAWDAAKRAEHDRIRRRVLARSGAPDCAAEGAPEWAAVMAPYAALAEKRRAQRGDGR